MTSTLRTRSTSRTPLHLSFRFGLGFALASLVALSGCALSGASQRGQLVIVGGGLEADNTDVILEFLEGAGDRIIIMPTASGEPEVTGPAAVENLGRHASPTQAVEVVAIEMGQADRARDPRFVAPIESATSAWFIGGAQERILAALRPDGVDSPAYMAVRDILRRGGKVGGSSAGAAMMSDPMIAWGNSEEALLNGADNVDGHAVRIQQGMGFFPYGLVDQHFLRRGRIGRLVVGLEATGQRFGYGIAENSALSVDLASNIGKAFGDGAVVKIDRQTAQRKGWTRSGLRVSLLSTGDRIDLKSGVIQVDSEKQPVSTFVTETTAELQPIGPWDAYALSILMKRLAHAPETTQRAAGDPFSMVLRSDANTRFMARDASMKDFCVVDAILDFEASASASMAAEKLSAEIAAKKASQ